MVPHKPTNINNMNKKEIQQWIEKNNKSITNNQLLMEQAKIEIEFAKMIIEEIKKITPEL